MRLTLDGEYPSSPPKGEPKDLQQPILTEDLSMPSDIAAMLHLIQLLNLQFEKC